LPDGDFRDGDFRDGGSVMDVLAKEKAALDRADKEKLAKLEQRLGLAPSESNLVAPDTDVFSDEDAPGAGVSATDASKKRPRKNFTEEEDAKLLEAFQQYGGAWDKIVEQTGLHRTARQCQDRMKRLKKAKEEQSPAHAPLAAPAAPAPSVPSPVAATAAPAAPKAGTRQATIVEKFGGGAALAGIGSPSPVGGAAVTAEWKRKLDEQRQKTMEALEALKVSDFWSRFASSYSCFCRRCTSGQRRPRQRQTSPRRCTRRS
jgi:hypothetical protein